MEKELIKHALWSAWWEDTAYNKTERKWNKFNRSFWQCAITALLIQETLWWEIIRADVDNYWFSHYWNSINWNYIDFTNGQFDREAPIFSNIDFSTRDQIISNEDTKKRFLMLKNRFNDFLDKHNTIESIIQWCRKCINASHFTNHSVHLWNNCSLLFIGEAPAKDWWRITWKAWINSQWNIIPSWKILQKLLDILWMNLKEITFTESVKCFPNERKFLKEMVGNCQYILHEQINTLDPNIIITLWDAPTKSLLKIDYKNFKEVVWKEHKITISNKEYILIPTYHPSPISPLSYNANVPIYELLKNSYQVNNF